MSVRVNGEQQPCAPNLRVLLARLELDTASVATALNGIFIPASEREKASLKAGDEVEVLAPMQGG